MKLSQLKKIVKDVLNEQTAIDSKNQNIGANGDKEFYDKFSQFSPIFTPFLHHFVDQ